MPRIGNSRLGRAALLVGLAAASLAVAGPTTLMVTPAQAQVSVGGDFRVALEPYGTWRHHRRFGEVWVPASRPRDWRPYTVGHWVYTDDYGWYWVTDDREGDWGWITYHYGRWYRDADYGWFWIPGDVWGPAWVDWRYSDEYVGWAPEPPDDVVVEVEDEPVYWCFVSAGDLVVPSIVTALLPFERRAEFFRRTSLVNRPVVLRDHDRRFAVDPGIPPGKIAAIRGQRLPTYQVRPRVLAGTAGVPGAIQVRAADLRRQREGGNRPAARERVATRDIIRSSSAVRPMRAAPQPQPLGRGEVGRLGATPPRAARNAAVVQSTAQRAPATPPAQQRQGEQRQTAAPEARRGPEQRRGNITRPNGPPSTTQAPAGPREGRTERRATERERNQPSSAIEQRRRTERTPVARTPAGNQGIVQRGPTARPPAERPAVVARPQVNRPPPAAQPPVRQQPAFAARPQPRPAPPPVAARPAPPPAAARPAPPPAAFARPAPPPAAARPATAGGQKRPQ